MKLDLWRTLQKQSCGIAHENFLKKTGAFVKTESPERIFKQRGEEFGHAELSSKVA
jgi:hypothetical protein